MSIDSKPRIYARGDSGVPQTYHDAEASEAVSSYLPRQVVTENEAANIFPFSPDLYIYKSGFDAHVLSAPSLKILSRRLCFLLRWGAPALHLPMTRDGYVLARDLRTVAALRTCTSDRIETVVRRDAKHRFSTTTNEDGEFMVRANHGHGIPGVEVVERDLTIYDAIGYIAHVTTYNAWSLIRVEGLRRMDRSHIHFVGRAPDKDEAVAGVRHGGEVTIFVDAHRAICDGIRFSVSPS